MRLILFIRTTKWPLLRYKNSIGQEVTSYTDYFNNGQLSIQLPEGTGVYFISVESNHEKSVKKTCQYVLIHNN